MCRSLLEEDRAPVLRAPQSVFAVIREVINASGNTPLLHAVILKSQVTESLSEKRGS